jgi:hypothetical protein
MQRTTAPGSVSGAYVDEDPGNSVQGTLLIALDRNAIQEEIVGVIAGAGLTPSAGNNGQLLGALQKGSGSTVNADLWRGLTPAQFITTHVKPVGSFYTQYPDASSNTDAVEFPVSQQPATLFGGTWVEQWSTESVFFRTRGSDSDISRTNGLQDDAMQGHRHTPLSPNTSFFGSASGGGNAGINAGTLTDYTGTTGNPTTDGANGTPRTSSETRPANRRIKVWKRTA